MIRSKLDAYKAKVAHTLHAQNPRYPQTFFQALGPLGNEKEGVNYGNDIVYMYVDVLIYCQPH